MLYGAHLPIIAFDERPWTLQRLRGYVRRAGQLGFRYLATNDHLVSPRPFLDSLTTMAAVTADSGEMILLPSIALPVVRGPVPLAKALAALDVLSDGRLVVGLGPGSSAADYAAVGIPFEERWARFDESVRVLRALLRRDSPAFRGRYYSTEGVDLMPRPVQDSGPPIWIGAWSSAASLRRTASLADGWLASAYNTTPQRFAESRRALGDLLAAAGKDTADFPNGISTAYCYITDDRAAVARALTSLSAALNRPESELADRLFIGPAGACAEKRSAFEEAGAQRIFVWPVADEEAQLELFMERVAG
jgi:alkanesulfonate monooxygenase SsuD/methylene tetrahydromethanopterin reductase-like flavin-dependent oxidoreductase (luciferase family)